VPTYQYACTSCTERLEVVQRFSDDPLTECPACGGALRKVFSPVGVVFKGSGFYKTDSRGSSRSSKPADKPAASSSASSSADAPAAPSTPSTSSGTGDSATPPKAAAG